MLEVVPFSLKRDRRAAVGVVELRESNLELAGESSEAPLPTLVW